MDKIKVLIVDDHAVLRDGIRALLDVPEDIEMVGEASEGKDALEKTQELAPDVVLMDLMMPGMDGLEATRRLKKKAPKVKVLILSQHDNREYILSAIKAGAAGYVVKKALGLELVSAIRAVYSGFFYLHPSVTEPVVTEYLKQAEEEPYDSLTAREREILKLIADGNTSREIADMLFISLKTVIGHRARIMEKLELHSSTELIKYAIRKGLIAIDT